MSMSGTGGGGGEAKGVCVCVCVWWRLLGDCGGLAKEGGEGERCPNRSGGGSTLAAEVVTLMAGVLSECGHIWLEMEDVKIEAGQEGKQPRCAMCTKERSVRAA
jgi:hypothetical protein